MTNLPKDKHSTKGIGSTMPNPQDYRVTDTGVVVPMGKGIPASVQYTSLLYNEYPLFTYSAFGFIDAYIETCRLCSLTTPTGTLFMMCAR